MHVAFPLTGREGEGEGHDLKHSGPGLWRSSHSVSLQRDYPATWKGTCSSHDLVPFVGNHFLQAGNGMESLWSG